MQDIPMHSCRRIPVLVFDSIYIVPKLMQVAFLWLALFTVTFFDFDRMGFDAVCRYEVDT